MAYTRESVPGGLVDDAKNALNITWSDPATDANVRGWIASGSIYLDGVLGEIADYTLDGLPRTLLMEYCRYARDEALDVFENNYTSMLLNAQTERQVTAYAQNALPCDP